jgi:hypothetical protein
MMSLQICRLVALVTSKNKSHVFFLILKKLDFRKEKLSEVDTSNYNTDSIEKSTKVQKAKTVTF